MTEKPYFDRVADDWDRMRSRFFSEAVRKAAFAEAQLKPGCSAADIGAGTGFLTEGLLSKGLKLIAVDPSEPMLQVLKEKFEDSGSLQCRVGQAENLPLEDACVDYAFANMVLHHVPDPLIALKEMTRILKSKGKLVITDLEKHDYAFLSKEQHDHWLGFEKQDIQTWLRQAGLREPRVRRLEEECCSESCAGAPPAKISIFLASGCKA